MPRIPLIAVATFMVAAGGAAAQPGYGGSGYPQPRAYPQASDDGREAGAYANDAGDDDDRGSAQRPGAEGDSGAYGDAGQSQPDLGRELALRADQRAALQTYQRATAPNQAEQQRDEADAGRLTSMTTPQRLDFVAAQMRRDQAAFATRADAVRRFYGQLTPAQQHRFDQLTGPQAQDAEAEDREAGDDPATSPRL